MQVGFAPGLAQSGSSAGGRRRLADENRPLFERSLDSLKNPGVNSEPQEDSQSAGRRLLEEEGLFSRSHHSLKTAHHRWANRSGES